MQSRKVGRHEVGICTVARSSADSSVVVPMKSKERQAQASFNSQLIKTCCKGVDVCMCEDKYTCIKILYVSTCTCIRYTINIGGWDLYLRMLIFTAIGLGMHIYHVVAYRAYPCVVYEFVFLTGTNPTTNTFTTMGYIPTHTCIAL